MDGAEEIRQLIDETSLGYKILSGAFSIILFMALGVWRYMIKSNNKRHEESEKQLKVAMKNQTALTILVNRHDVEIDNIKDKIKS